MASKHSADQTDPIEEKVTHTESDTSRGVDKGLGTSVSITEDETSHLSLARAAATINPERRIVIEKRLVRKIDCFLFPMLLAFYILNYIVSNIVPRKGQDKMTDYFRIVMHFLMRSWRALIQILDLIRSNSSSTVVADRLEHQESF